jgi:hypothetical protein
MLTDRRPMHVIDFYSGIFNEQNPYGHSPYLLQIGMAAYMAENIARMSDEGADRVMLYMPHGHIDDQYAFSSASWYTMPALWRQQIGDAISDDVARTGRTYCLYSGGHVPDALDPASLYDESPQDSEIELADATRAEDRQWLQDTIVQWARIGVREWGIDASTKRLDRCIGLRDYLAPFGISKIIQEAVPHFNAAPGTGAGGRRWDIDRSQTSEFACLRLLSNRNAFDPDQLHRFSVANEECHLFIQFNSTYSAQQLAADLAAGYVVSPWSGVSQHQPELFAAIKAAQPKARSSSRRRRRIRL